jgi:hypothetical protein
MVQKVPLPTSGSSSTWILAAFDRDEIALTAMDGQARPDSVESKAVSVHRRRTPRSFGASSFLNRA